MIDGDLEKGHEHYRYGGMWKNKHAGVSAKVPRRLKGKLGRKTGYAKRESEPEHSDDSDGSDGSVGSAGSIQSPGSSGSKRDITQSEQSTETGT